MKLSILILQIFLVNNIVLAFPSSSKKRQRPEESFLESFSNISIGNLTDAEERDLESLFITARSIIEGGHTDEYQDVINTVQNKPQVLNHVDAQDKKTLFMLAAEYGLTELLEVFINYVDQKIIFACDHEGCNALYLAELNHHEEAKNIILQHTTYEKNSRQRKRMRR